MSNKRFDDNGDGRQRKDWVRHNEQIRISVVRVIHNGTNLGEMSNRKALELARSYNLDLVEVSPRDRPPVCHIIDYGKFMFERSKKKKEASKQSHTKEKEISFRYVIGDGDLETKASQIRGFIEKGMKVKCVCKFERREKAHKDQGFVVMERLVKMVGDVAILETPIKFEGANVICKLEKKD